MGVFKEGDWVRRVTTSHWPHRYGEKGRLYQVKSTGRHCNIDVMGNGQTAAELEFEPWTPAVGDRVRMVKDGLSTTGAAGKLATVDRWNDGSFIDADGNQYLLKIDPPYDYSTMALHKEYTRATLDCFEPVVGDAVEAVAVAKFKVGDRVRVIDVECFDLSRVSLGSIATVKSGGEYGSLICIEFKQPFGGKFTQYAKADQIELADTPATHTTTQLQIEAGRYYKTRDGRKVGPVEGYDGGIDGPFRIVGLWNYRSDGLVGSISEGDHKDDLIALWQDEPANDNAADAALSVTITADTSELDAEIDRVKRRLKKLAKRARKLGIDLEFSDLRDAA